MKKLMATLLALTLLATLTSCNSNNKKVIAGFLEKNEIEQVTLQDWRDSAENGNADNNYPADYEEIEYPSLNELLLALDNNKINFAVTTLNTGKYICDQNQALTYLKGDRRIFYKMAMLEENSALCNKINEAITEIKNSTALFDLMNSYITNYATAPSTTVKSNPDFPTYKVGVTGNVPPLDYITADGTPSGFNVAILNLIGEKIGANFEFVSVENNARTTALTTGIIDIIFCENVTEQSDLDEFLFDNKKLILTDYYYSDSAAFVTKDYPIDRIRDIYGIKETNITSFGDLKGKNVGVAAGSYDEQVAREKLPDSYIIPIPLQQLMYSWQTMLMNGTLDAVIEAKSTARNIKEITILDEILASSEKCMAIAKNRTSLQNDMNEVITKFEEDGTIDKLKNKWFNADDYSKVRIEADTDYECPNGVLKYLISSNCVPYEFYDSEWRGYDYELLLMVCKELGYGLELIPFTNDYATAIDAVANGDADIIAAILATEERAEKLLFIPERVNAEMVVCVYNK